MLLRNKYIKKSWGWELWFDNNELYCGKVLFIEKDKWSSKRKYHYHKLKTETFLIIEGTLILDWIDENNRVHTETLKNYNSFRIESHVKHRFTTQSKNGCKFIEVSTTHSDNDSYRC